MLHEPSAPTGPVHAVNYKSRLGLWMFLVYGVIYGGFVLINIAKPLLMQKKIVAGLNLAVVYGFGLIILALVLAIIYNAMCTKRESNPASSSQKGGEK
jgi:uncharacterized membrane protein (DUF485 family)